MLDDPLDADRRWPSSCVGLVLDDTNQYDQTESRIEQWVDQILSEIHELL
jgi:flavodoxin